MGEIAAMLKGAKQQYKKLSLQEYSCKWCSSKSLKDQGEVKGFIFVECRSCGFTFCPYISQEFMDRLYGQGYHANEEKVPGHGWSRVGFLEPVLKRYGPEESLRILDFGCGQSKVPKKLREMGHKVLGVDVTPPRHPHPDRITRNLPDLQLAPEQFDVVYSFQVFEHLSEPAPIFRELIRITKPGGYILIHTDMETPERKEGFSNWWYVLPPDHIRKAPPGFRKRFSYKANNGRDRKNCVLCLFRGYCLLHF